MIRSVLLVVLAAVPLVGRAAEVECPPTSRPSDLEHTSSTGCVGELGWFPLAHLSIATGASLAELEARLRSPPKRVWSGPERFKGEYTVTFREFKVPGIRVLTSQAEGSALVSLEEFELSTRDVALPCRLELGQDRAQVMHRLGLAIREEKVDRGSAIVTGWTRYWCDDRYGDVTHAVGHGGIHLYFDEQNKLRKLFWSYTAD